MGASVAVDKQNRPYAKLSELKAGDHVELDNGFDCHVMGVATIHADDRGDLYFACHYGKHYIADQADGGGTLIGIYPKVQ